MIRPQSIQVGSRIALTTFLCLLLVLSPVAAATGGMGANTSNGTTNDTIASDGATGEVDTSGNVSTSSTSNDASGNASNTSTDASNNTSGNVSNTSTDASNSEPVRVAGTAEDGSIGLTATSDGTNGTNDSAVRNLTESIITSDLNATYDRIYERGLNAEYWDSVSEDRAQTVVENTIGTFKPTGRDVAQSILEKAAQRAGVTTSYATNAMLIAEVGANYLMFAAAIDASNIGPNMRLANYDAVRNDLQDLQQSTQDIRTADTYAEKRDAFEERRSTLRSLYTKLPTYTNGIHSNIQENPIYDINFIDSGGVNWNLGRSSYSTIRLQTEALRQQLVADYQYTDSWLANETTNASLAADTGVDMPRHRLDFSTQATRYYDTIDTAGDYTIYRVSPPESITGADKDLRVRIATADPENVSATLSTSKPSPGDIGSGENFRTRRSDLITTVEGVESTDYYVAVKSDRPAFYKFEASVYHPYLLGAVRLNNSGPPVAPVEAGSSGSEGSESVSEPAPPDPELECTCITPTEDGFTVGVTATNRGGESAWQSVAVSLPNVTNASNVEIRSHNLDYAQVYTGEVASAYGTANVTTSYPLVEGAATNWSQGERKHLELHVTAPPNTTYDVYAKSVARGDGAWTAAPEIGATDTTDQQREFVRVKEYTHAETSFNRTTAWETVGGNRGHTGTNPTPDAPTHNVSQEWRRTLDGQPAHSPTVVGDRAYITTTNDTVYGLDRTNGTELWRFYAPTALSSAPTYENGTLYVSSPARVYVLNAHTGTQLCDCAFGLNEKDAATPVVKDDTLYVTARVGDQYDTDEGAVYAFDRTSRSVEWRRQFGNHAIDVPPAVTDTTVYVAARDGTVWALDRRTGNTRWRKSFSGFRGAPTVRDGTVYLGDTNGNVYALDTNGDVRWRYRAGYGIHESLAVDDERVYANAGDRLVALDRTEGTWRWSYRAGNQLTTAPAVANGTVYVGSKEAQRVYGVDTGDGTERWRYYTDLVRTAPALTDNELYVGAGESLIALTGGTDAPSAAFTPSTTTPETGVEVTFDAGSTADGTAPLTYEWDLTGDGTFNHTGEQVTRAFPSAGTVWPTLRVTDANGASDTTTERIAVAPSGGHWITRGGDYAHTASLPSVHGPTHNVTQAWSAPMGGTVSAPPTVENDTVYVAADGGQVRALSRDGTERWSVDVGATPLSPTVANGTAYVAASNNRVYAFDVATGDLQWSYNTGDKGITQAIVYEDSVYVTTRVGDSYDTDEGAVYALDPETGQREWHQEFGNQPIDAPAAISSTTVYVATQNGEVRALDRLSGTQRWMKSFGGGFDSAPTLQDGTLYVGNKNGDVVALESSNGNERWRYHTGYSVHHSLAVDGDRVYANVGERLVALTRAGRWAWTQRFDDPLSTAPTVTNRTVYVGSKEAQRVYGLDAADGTERWRYYTSRVHSAPVVDNGTVYVGARQSLDALTGGTGGPSARADLSTTTPETGTEVALDAGSTTLASGRTATYRWDLTGDGTFNHTGEQVTTSFTDTGDVWVTLNVTDSAGASDTVRRRITVQPTEDAWRTVGSDRRFSGRAGSDAGVTHDVRTRWRTRFGGAVDRAPTVVNGTAYVPTTDGVLHALDRASGTELWSVDVGASPRPPTVANGTAYVTASNNRVYAFDVESGDLQWSYNTGDKGISQAIVYEDSVYVTTRVGDSYDTDEGAVYALDPETGQREWHQEFGNQPIDSPPVVTDTTVYVATQKGEVRALDRLSGTPRWTESFSGGFDSAPTIRDNTLYVGNKNGDVLALDPSDGSTEWSRSIEGSIHRSLAVSDERVYAVAGDELVAVSRSNHSERWTFQADGVLTTPPVVTDGTAYVGSKEGQRIYGVDTFDGSERWRHYTSRLTDGLALVNDTLYYGTRGGLTALTGETGAPSAAIEYAPENPTRNVSVNLTARARDADGEVVTYAWDLDDDGVFNEADGTNATTSFDVPGEHTVRLRVTDDQGVSDTATAVITVPDDRRPNAALYASDTVVATGETVRFNASNSTDAVGIERIAWRVNNESAGTGPTLARTFDSPGNYTVLVRVTDGAGNTGTAFATVSVVGSFGENLSANRTITGSLRPGTNATVTLRARANTTVNGLAVREEIPAGLTVLSKSSSPTATYREETREWLWRDAAPNETYTVEYTVRIPGDATFGTAYNFSGAVSAYAQQPAPVAGDQSLPVAACLNRVVAGSDRTLSVTEVQRALAWWANDTAVPNTNGRHIGMERMQRFVHAWQTGSQVECGSLEDTASVGTATGPGVLNTMATADVPTVAQSPNVSVTWENDTVTVETVVESGTLDAPGLDLSLPAGWDVVSQSARNATYRASDDQWVWLTEGPKTLAYTLSVPANASNGTAALAADGSGIGSAGAYRETTDTTALQVDNAGLRARTAILSAVHNAESTLRLDLDADSAVDIEHVSVRSPTDTTLGVRNLSGQHAAATVSPTLRNATWNGTDYESATYTVVVTNDAGRSWTQNVSIRVFEAGDATGDGAVDIFDAVAVGTSFDATRENATYSPAADLNNDGEVDVLDATLIGRNWDGRSEAG